MSLNIEITDEDILYAEQILLHQGKCFDDERREFIRNLSTLDLQAVPGSGKTTAILAKLLILETKLPLKNGAGILVLSHTNAAVDEIKNRIQAHCPKLFRYPNFIGTIQSFVNEFLAIPYYSLKLKRKPIRIDNDIYFEQIDFLISNSYKTALTRRRINYHDILSNSFISSDNKLKNYWTNTETIIPQIGSHTNTYKELCRIKKYLISLGILSFSDCYALAKKYLNNYPNIIKILRKRFRYVFIDEMQDMDIHQYELIESIFFENTIQSTIIQRIGDKNQSIYNTVKAESIWQERSQVLHLSNSQRLSPPIANIVKNFALYPGHCTNIRGMYDCQLKPHILLFSNENIKNVIPFFSQLVLQYVDTAEIKKDPIKPLKVKVISWNTDWKDNEASRGDPSKIRLEDYHDNFIKDVYKPRNDYDCLKSYCYFYDKNNSSLASIRKNILHALLKILRLEKISTNDNKLYTIANLMKYLKDFSKENYDALNLTVYQCTLKLINDEKNEALLDLKRYIPIFIKYFKNNHNISQKCLNFINNESINHLSTSQNHDTASNPIEETDFKIEVTSVHAVKGQTHDATLYLESFYHKHESEHLPYHFLGKKNNSNGVRVQQATKMAYVGFSRASQLLCIAIHKDRFDQHLHTIDRNLWVVKEI